MNSRKGSKRILRTEAHDPDFDKDIEEAKTLRDFERLERKDSHFWLLNIFMILVLTLFILVKDFETLNRSPRELLSSITSFHFSGLVFPAAILLLGFCAYVFSQNRKIRIQRREIFVNKIKMERMVGAMEEVVALFRISSGISNHKEPPAILETIARESFACLKAHRSTVFLLEEKSGILKIQFTLTSDPLNEQVGLFEEKEVARKVLRQRKPCLLRAPGDFSEFFKYEERDRKITSLMSIPMVSQDRGVGVLSVVMIDEERKFTERDLQFFMIFAQQASIALENSYLLEEARKGASFRKNYEQYLDHILNQLQSLSDVERRRIEDHIGKLLPSRPAEEKPSLSEQDEEVVKGTLPLGEPMAAEGQGEDRGAKMLRVEMEGEHPAMAHDLAEGGVFIRTPNPLDLGEQFLLKLHLAEGEEPIEVTCKVIWTNKYGKESRNLRRGMGVKFLNLTPVMQRRVEEYIRSHKNQQFSLAEDQHRLSLEE